LPADAPGRGEPDTRADPGAAGPLVAREVEIGDEHAEIRLGRRADLELPLPFPALSAIHARVRRAPGEGAWLVEDARSTNGTWLDGALLPPGEPRPFAPGAELRLGNVRVRFEGAGPASPAAAGTGTIARRLVDDLFASHDDDGGAPVLRVLRGAPPRRLALTQLGRGYVAGRGEGCDLPLGVEEVSREHATFERLADGVVVRDLGSKNGVVVGGARIAGARRLVDGDVVEIGPVALAFEDPVERYLSAGGAAPPPRAPPNLEASRAGEARAPVDESAAVAKSSASVGEPAPVAKSAVEEPIASPKRRSSAEVIVVVAVGVLVLLAVVAGVLVFGRG